MYQTPCRNCNHVYTGESKRTLKVRMAEHKQAIQKSDPNNGIAVPVAQSHHSIDWAEVQLVRSGQGYWEKRLTMETIQIKRSEGLCFPSVWNPGSTKLNHPVTLTTTLTLAIIISALLGPCHARMITSVKSITYLLDHQFITYCHYNPHFTTDYFRFESQPTSSRICHIIVFNNTHHIYVKISHNRDSFIVNLLCLR